MNNPFSGGVVLEILPVDQVVLPRYEEFVCSKCCYWLEGKEVERDHDKWGRWHEAMLDIKLPDMQGTELLTKLPSHENKMVKIMVTGNADLEDAIKSVNLGADAYITKSVGPEYLLSIVALKLREQKEADKMQKKEMDAMRKAIEASAAENST